MRGTHWSGSVYDNAFGTGQIKPPGEVPENSKMLVRGHMCLSKGGRPALLAERLRDPCAHGLARDTYAEEPWLLFGKLRG